MAENPDKAFMDHILEWRLIHRTREALRGLFGRPKFADTPMEVTYEEQHVNIFAICAKRGAPARPSRQSGVMAVMQG